MALYTSGVRVLHLASFDRWSGAVDPAFHEAAALRAAGVDAFFGYVGGYKLEARLQAIPWALPILRTGHGIAGISKSVAAIRRAIAAHGIEILHAHLSWDHQLAALARSRGIRLVRTYHAGRSIRRYLLRHTNAVAVVNQALADHPLLRGRNPKWTPATIDHARFKPSGPRVEMPRPAVGAIGKLSPDRGFEDVLRAVSLLDAAHLSIIGEGPHQPKLTALATDLGIRQRVTFAGYHEDDLPAHYRGLDALLFTGEGSDQGHRAVAEAMACGVPVAAYPFQGIEAVIGEPHAGEFVCRDRTPAPLAERARDLMARRDSLGAECVEATRRFGFAPAAQRLLQLYESARI